MANHKITIEVVDSGSLGGVSNNNNNPPGKSIDIEKELRKKQAAVLNRIANPISSTVASLIKNENEDVQTKQRYLAQTALSLATQAGRSIFSYYVSDIGRYTGDQSYANYINRQLEVVSDISNAASSAANGAVAGFTVAGPIGAAVGAVSGIISSSISLIMRQLQRERAYAATLDSSNNAQTVNIARANYSTYTGRVR